MIYFIKYFCFSNIKYWVNLYHIFPIKYVCVSVCVRDLHNFSTQFLHIVPGYVWQWVAQVKSGGLGWEALGFLFCWWGIIFLNTIFREVYAGNCHI